MNMKKLSFLAALVVAMTAVSCVQDMNEGAPVSDNGATIFTASFDAAAASKAVLKPGETESKVEWEAGDQVSVLTGSANYLYTANAAGATTTLTTEATDVPTEGTFYAVYPYNADAAVVPATEAETPDSISTVLPAQQTAVKGSFATHLAVAKAADNKFAFKNVCALVKVNIAADGVTKIVFEGNDSEVVAGGINVAVADAPAWKAVEGQGATSVALVSATALEAGDYFFAVLPQTFAAGFKVTAYKGEESWVVRNVTASTTLERAGIVGGKSFFEIEGNGTEANPYILKTPAHLVGMRSLATYGGETWFKMANDIDMKDVTNYVPVNYDQNFERKINFDGNKKTISNFKCSHSTYPSLFGVLYGTCKDLNVTNAEITAAGPAGIIGGYVGTVGKPALVENVTITNSSVVSSGDRSGGVAGDAKNATFKSVSFQGSVMSSYTEKESKTGGFAGVTEDNSTFEGCSVDVIVSGKSHDVAGFIGKTTGVVNLSCCNAKVEVTFDAGDKNRCGGFIGWNAATTSTISDCHVLAGSTLTSYGTGGDIGGFIGYADANTTTTVDISDSSAEINLSATNALESSVFIGIIGYTPTVTITNCFAKGENLTTKNYIGGLVGRVNKANVTITGCYFDGKLKGASGVGGLVGAIEGEGTSGELNINKSYVKGEVSATGHNSGCIAGLCNGPIVVENSYTDIAFTMLGQFGGGIVGSGQGSVVSVKNCYSTGTMDVSRGVGGIIGRAEGTTKTEVLNCVSWISKIKTSRGANQYSVGAIVGVDRDKVANFKACWRRADMVLEDVNLVLANHDDVVDGLPPYAPNSTDKNLRAYHGKAAAANATVSTVAQSLGWSSEIWDFSGAFPTLK